MSAISRPHLIAGMALAGASLAAVAPIVRGTHLSEPQLASPDVALTAGESVDFSDLLNVPVNLFNDMMNIPYNLFEAPYSVKGMIPNFVNEDGADGQHTPGTELAADPNNPIDDPSQAWPEYHDFDGNPDGDTYHGALNFLSAALDYTGSFYVSNPTNVFGWDTGNTWNLPAAIDALLPFTREGPDMTDNPIGDNINTVAEAEFPEASGENAYFFKDVIGELQTLFTVPFSKLVSGYDLPADGAFNPVGVGNDALGDGGLPYHDLWSGEHVTVTPGLGFDTYFEHLLQDPSDNEIHPLDPSTILPTIGHAQQAINIDFNPLSAGEDSFIFAAAKDLYGLPALINGIFNGEHGLDPGGPDVIPDTVTQPLGNFLNDIIGPDSGLAQALIAIDKPFDAFVNSLSDFEPYDTLNNPLPDTGTDTTDAVSASDEPTGAAADMAHAFDLPF